MDELILWVKERLAERTSWDGIVLLVVGVFSLLAHPMLNIAAWVAVVWGAWTLWKAENK
jgi:hypothetical protein